MLTTAGIESPSSVGTGFQTVPRMASNNSLSPRSAGGSLLMVLARTTPSGVPISDSSLFKVKPKTMPGENLSSSLLVRLPPGRNKTFSEKPTIGRLNSRPCRSSQAVLPSGPLRPMLMVLAACSTIHVKTALSGLISTS